MRVPGLTGSATANTQTVSTVADAQYASDPYGYGSGNVIGTTYAYAQLGGTATLDPFSEMVIRVPYALTITASNQAGEWANAGVWLTAIRNADGSQWLTSQANWSSGWTYSTFSDTGKLGLLLSNTTATPQTFSVNAYASANAGTVAAVPEPETYSMMMAGLGLLGFVARKRNQPAV